MAVYAVGDQEFEVPDNIQGQKLADVLSGLADQGGGEQKGIEFGTNILRQINQGLFLGFGDEIEAAIGSVPDIAKGGDISESFAKNIGAIRKSRGQFQQENPALSLGSEVAGGLFTGGLGGAKLASQLPQAGAALKSAVTVAPAAAVAGAGAADPQADLGFADSLSERIGGALKGVALGSAFGALTPKAQEILSGAGQAVATKTREAFQGAQTKALRLINQAMERDALSVEKILRKKAVLGPQATLADVGDENIAQLVDNIAQQPGAAKARVKKALTERLQGQRGRLKELIKERVHPMAENLEEARTSLNEQLRVQASPLFNEAMDQPVSITKSMESILENPKVKNLIPKAINQARADITLPQKLRDGLNPPSASSPGVGLTGRQKPTPNMVTLHYVQRQLSDNIGTAIRQGKDNEVRILTNIKKALVKQIDAQVPVYQQARKIWSDGKSNEDALNLGRDVFKEAKKGVGNVERLFNDMSVSEQEHFRLGASNEMFRLMDNVSDTLDGRPAASMLNKIFGSPSQKQAVKAIIDDPKSFRNFERALKAERKFIDVSNKTLGNSATTRRLASQADQQLDVSDAADIASGRISGVFNVLKRLSSGKGLDEATRSELGKRLTTQSAADIRATLLDAKRQGSLIPKSVESALSRFNDAKFVKWIKLHPEKITKALAVTAAVEGQ